MEGGGGGWDAAGKGAEALGNYMAAREAAAAQKKVAKIGAKEQKRKTKADLLSQALSQAYESSKEQRSGQRETSGNRMKALMDVAANVRAALAK
jgi:flagellar motor switch/type III secretory pathway protein FliN